MSEKKGTKKVIRIERTNSSNEDFNRLVYELDLDLQIRDGDDHPFFAQFNTLDTIQHVVVAYDGQHAVGCGAIRQYDGQTMEIKRMFVSPENRGFGIASLLLTELEYWATELGCSRCILETGINQPEAIALYEKTGYKRIQNYGQYAGIDLSVCFGKDV
jgi:putative acetyltransferase